MKIVYSYELILLNYCQLASTPQLGDEESEELDKILAQTESDEVLNFLLGEVDYILGEKFNLLDQKHLKSYDDQLAYLREHLEQISSIEIDYYREFQKLLQEKGCYAGPVDGVFGNDSREAVRKFQESCHLPANGQLNDETVLQLTPSAQTALKLSRRGKLSFESGE
jgi:Putative peptidoglycan binding domain